MQKWIYVIWFFRCLEGAQSYPKLSFLSTFLTPVFLALNYSDSLSTHHPSSLLLSFILHCFLKFTFFLSFFFLLVYDPLEYHVTQCVTHLLPFISGKLCPKWVPVVETVSPSPKARTFSQTTCSTYSLDNRMKDKVGKNELKWLVRPRCCGAWELRYSINNLVSTIEGIALCNTIQRYTPLTSLRYTTPHCIPLRTRLNSSPLRLTKFYITHIMLKFTHLFVSEWRPSVPKTLLLKLLESSSSWGDE